MHMGGQSMFSNSLRGRCCLPYPFVFLPFWVFLCSILSSTSLRQVLMLSFRVVGSVVGRSLFMSSIISLSRIQSSSRNLCWFLPEIRIEELV